MSEDTTLLRQLRGMWEAADPAPADLAERTLFTLGLEDLEFELMRLLETLSPAGARGEDTMTTVTFTDDRLTVMVTIARGQGQTSRLDGWITPAAPLRVELRGADGSRDAWADSDGRFAFPDAAHGLMQMVFHPTEGAPIVLAKPVATPAIQI